MTEVLDLHAAEAPAWFISQERSVEAEGSVGGARPAGRDRDPAMDGRPPQEQAGRVHLLLGCSIARGAGLRVSEEDMLINRARSGETWRRLEEHVGRDLQRWRGASAAFGLQLGRVIIWLTGNEAYDRHTGHNRLHGEDCGPLEGTIRRVLDTVRRMAAPVVLGPLPRFVNDRLLPWEHTAAYKLDRKVREAAEEGGDEFRSLGKSLTKKQRRRHVVLEDCREWFATDGIHLSPAGYRKVAQAGLFPKWLLVRDSE